MISSHLWMLLVAMATSPVTTNGQNDNGICGTPPPGVIPALGLCVEIFQDDLVVEESRHRGLAIHDGEVFALERGGAFNEWQSLTGYIVVYDTSSDASTGKLVNTTSTVLVSKVGLTHGITVSKSHVYASTADAVHRWNYTKGMRTKLEVSETIIENIPSSTNQSLHTRSLLWTEDAFYVSIGSEQNVDPDLGRAGIRAFPSTLSFPVNWTEGTILATGLRNAVGIALDGNGNLWAVDSSADGAVRNDLGGDISDDNPGDELNLIDPAGKTYGYPFCWTEYRLPSAASFGRGSQWAWQDPEIFPQPKQDSWCRETENNSPPEAVFPAHSAPLGVAFYQHQNTWPEDCPENTAFPDEWDGHAFVAFHGNYFRDSPIPGQVVRIPISSAGSVVGGVAARPESILRDAGPLSGIRPVDVSFDLCGRLLVTSDGRPGSEQGRMILRLQHEPFFAPGGSSTNGLSTPVTVGLVVIVGMIAIAIGVGFLALGRHNRNVTVTPASASTMQMGSVPTVVTPEIELN